MSEAKYGLIVAFTDESPSFVHGFEAGRIDEQMSRPGVPGELIEGVVHAANSETLRRLAARRNWTIDLRPSSDPLYAEAVFTRRLPPREEAVTDTGVRLSVVPRYDDMTAAPEGTCDLST